MIIAVCVKQILDPEVPPPLFQIDSETKQAIRSAGVEMVMSPFDEQAVEAAVQLKEAEAGKSEISVILFSVGTADAKDMLKHGLSMGADEAVLISAEDFDVSDSFATASVLVQAIESVCEPDLILTGRQAADFDVGVVGAGVGELLQWPILNWAKSVTVESGQVKVERVLSNGVDRVSCDLPAVVSIANEFGVPRKPSLRETKKSARKPISELNSDTFEGSEKLFDHMPRQKTVDVAEPEKSSDCQIIDGDSADEIAEKLVSTIRDAKLI